MVVVHRSISDLFWNWNSCRNHNLVIYFYDDIRKNLRFSQYTDNTYNINNVNIRPGSDVSDKDDFDTPIDHLGKDTREEMR